MKANNYHQLTNNWLQLTKINILLTMMKISKRGDKVLKKCP